MHKKILLIAIILLCSLKIWAASVKVMPSMVGESNNKAQFTKTIQCFFNIFDLGINETEENDENVINVDNLDVNTNTLRIKFHPALLNCDLGTMDFSDVPYILFRYIFFQVFLI